MGRTSRAGLVSLLLTALIAGTGGIGVRKTVTQGPAFVPGIPSGYYVAYLTDVHPQWAFGGTTVRNSVPFGAVIDTLNSLGAKLCIMGPEAEDLFPGVNANEDSFVAITSRATFPIYPVLCNHEAIAADTLGNPYATAAARWSSYFGSANYYYRDLLNLRVIVVQNNANVDASAEAYRINNPFSGGWIPAVDYDGITDPASPQRTWLTATLAGRQPGHWLIIAGHRPTHGDSASTGNMRGNLHQGRGTGYIRQVEQSLATNERGLALMGDQHLPLLMTKTIADSGVSSAGGLVHMILASGSGARSMDTTVALGPSGLDAYLYYDGSTRAYGRTSVGWADTMTLAGDPGLPYTFTWALLKVMGDAIYAEVFRTWTTQSAGHAMYTGSRTHRRIHAVRISRSG